MACTEVVSAGVAEPASVVVAEGGVACNHQCAQASEGTVSVLSLYSRGEEPEASSYTVVDPRGGVMSHLTAPEGERGRGGRRSARWRQSRL